MNLKIGYLGKRDYIDVSTLSTALYTALPEITDNTLIRDLDIRLLKKVMFDCELILHKNLPNQIKPGHDIAVAFQWIFKGDQYTAHFKETEHLITDRFPELVDDPKDHMIYENEEVRLFNPINDDSIYNLMKMGRLIVVKKYNLAPRVVRSHFDRLFNKAELKDVVMKGSFFAPKDFYRLETFKDGQKFGEVIIKGLPLN